MIRIALTALLFVALAAAQKSPLRHYWPANSNTTPEAFLASIASDYGLSQAELSSLRLAKDYTTQHNGVRHLIYRQQWQGIEVSGAEYTINLGPDGTILNAGGTLYPNPGDFPQQTDAQALRAMRAAVKRINPKLPESATARTRMSPRFGTSRVAFSATGLREDVVGEPMWVPDQGELKPGWRFVVAEQNSPSRFLIDVNAATLATGRKQPLVFYQTGPRGLVYEKGSPQPNPKPGTLATTAPPIVERTVQSFSGDPKASPRGWTNGVETSGNNTVTGQNLPGTPFLYTPTTAKGTNGLFSFPITVGTPLAGADAAVTNLFYWVNRAHDLHYASGFDEAAGNFQLDNFGRGGTGGDPVYAYAHYGAQAFGSANTDNAFFSTKGTDEDGGQPMIAMFVATGSIGYGGPYQDITTDGALDASIIIHEYTHGVSTRLARQAYETFQGSSMGEGWSDFFGIEYTLPESVNPNGTFLAGEYWEQAWGRGFVRSRPYSTDLAVNSLTFDDLGKVYGQGIPEVHADGEIWVEALWEMRANLIAQFGEAEGRRRARLLVIDGMKLQLPRASMVDARDGILLADQVDFKGASQAQIWAAFAKRGLGALAYSANADTVRVTTSYDVASPAGKLRFNESTVAIGETIRLVLQDSNLTAPTQLVQITSGAGDVENVILKRVGAAYSGEIGSSANNVSAQNGTLNIMPNDQITAYYVDADTGSGAATLVQTTIDTIPAYTALGGSSATYTFSGETILPLDTDPLDGFAFAKTPVNLGFDFKFFDKKYKTAYVYSNGLIGFGSEPAYPFCTDRATFSQFIGIAPMFSYIEINGSAQPREGVYVSRTAKSVTFRWVGETWLPDAFVGTPINFATTLYDDGRIVTQYPSGNQFPQQSFVNLGCGASPVIGLSNGHTTYSPTYAITQFSNFVLAFEPAFGASSIPSGRLESPAADAKVQDILTVSGVAFDSTPLSRIDIIIDGVQRAISTRGLARPDACSPTQPGCPNVGFSQNINLRALNLTPGTHTIRVRITNRRGSFTELPADGPRTFTIDEGQSRLPVIKLEAPVEGARITGNLTLTGYALIDTLRVSAVDVLIDGLAYTARYGVARADVCTSLRSTSPNCPGVGFSATISTRLVSPPIANGKHGIQVRVRDETGRITVYPETPVTVDVQNGDAVPIFGAITSVKQNDKLSGVVTVTGYAYSPGRRITSGTLLIDGFSVGRVTLNQPAPDVCATLPDANACPNIGFRYDLDTRTLLNGDHLLGIRFVNDRGDNLTLPVVNSFGINVVIEN